ncbi:hypothetical protein B9Z55_004251 [Caenorhabditis nigoni]|nr:hypothetical protein B9Z55_004251 [Caenorhabditis nigoni]
MAGLILDSNDLNSMALQNMVNGVTKQLRESINVMTRINKRLRHPSDVYDLANVIRKNLNGLLNFWNSVLGEVERRDREQRNAPPTNDVKLDDMSKFNDGMGGRIQMEGLDERENERLAGQYPSSQPAINVRCSSPQKPRKTSRRGPIGRETLATEHQKTPAEQTDDASEVVLTSSKILLVWPQSSS